MTNRTAFACSIAILTGCVASLARAEADAPRPNVLVIMADDLGWGDLGCYGHPTIRTPRLDRLAAEGLRFTQFYSAAEVCTPSRAGLLTGRLPIRSGLHCGNRRVLFPNSTGGIPAGERTLAEALREAGYDTACIGKWHLGHLPQFLPTQHGFDHYFGIPYSNDMSPAHSPVGRAQGWPATPLLRDATTIESEPDQRLLTRRYTDEAIAFLRAARQRQDNDPSRRFFLYLPHTMPHVPLFAEPADAPSPRGLYGDVVEAIDESLGHLLDALRELHFDENTLVVFTSDNGPWIQLRQAGGSAGPLRSGKGSTWEGGYRVPGIFWWPGHISPGISTALASALDLFPTCLALAGASASVDLPLDGFDLSGVLLSGKPSPRDVHFYYRGSDLFAVRRGPWKLHVQTQDGYGQSRSERHDPGLLFHLEHDPGEQYNVAREHADIVEELTALAERQRADVVPAEPQL